MLYLVASYWVNINITKYYTCFSKCYVIFGIYMLTFCLFISYTVLDSILKLGVELEDFLRSLLFCNFYSYLLCSAELLVVIELLGKMGKISFICCLFCLETNIYYCILGCLYISNIPLSNYQLFSLESLFIIGLAIYIYNRIQLQRLKT